MTSSEIDEERRNKEEEMRSMGLNRVLIKTHFSFFFLFKIANCEIEVFHSGLNQTEDELVK